MNPFNELLNKNKIPYYSLKNLALKPYDKYELSPYSKTRITPFTINLHGTFLTTI